MDLQTYYLTVFYVMAGITGLCVGSFLNVVIYRVPLNMSLSNPPSHCPKCDYRLKWYDNIPVISYLSLGGKCRNCKEPISFRYTAVEILNTVFWLLCVWRFRDDGILYAVLAAICCSVLICVFFTDLENMIIPDRFQIILGIIAVLWIVYGVVSGDKKAWISHLIGGAVGFGVFMFIAFAGEKIAKREALGGGDIKLCSVMGLLLGWQKLTLSVLIASITASVVLMIIKSVKKESGKEYPFAPFLASGFIISLLFGDAIISAYLSLVLNI